MMVLSNEDADLFYELWPLVLDYVNKKYKINSAIKNVFDARPLNPQDVKEIADRMWDDVSVIDEFLDKNNSEISGEHKEIIKGWKRRVRGDFLLERNLKKGSMFISMEGEQVYQVSGIQSSWEEMFWYTPMPVMMKATLIPFKDVIISDGLVMAYSVRVGPTMKRNYKDIYITAKNSGLIHKTL